MVTCKFFTQLVGGGLASGRLVSTPSKFPFSVSLRIEDWIEAIFLSLPSQHFSSNIIVCGASDLAPDHCWEACLWEVSAVAEEGANFFLLGIQLNTIHLRNADAQKQITGSPRIEGGAEDVAAHCLHVRLLRAVAAHFPTKVFGDLRRHRFWDGIVLLFTRANAGT